MIGFLVEWGGPRTVSCGGDGMSHWTAVNGRSCERGLFAADLGDPVVDAFHGLGEADLDVHHPLHQVEWRADGRRGHRRLAADLLAESFRVVQEGAVE